MPGLSLRILALGILPLGCFDPGVSSNTSNDGTSDASTTAPSGSTRADSTTGTNGDASEGPGPSCDGAEQACLAAAPNGWAGPVFAYEATPDALPDCPSAAPDTSILANNGIAADPASCGCECGDPLADDCAPAALEAHSSGACDNLLSSTALPPGDCIDIPGGGSGHRAAGNLGPTPITGSCEPLGSVDLPEPTWSEAVRACIGAPTPSEDCAVGQVCVDQPPLSPPFRVCIHRAGDQECPGGAYPEQLQAFTGFDDSRACGECTCGSLEDGSCARSIALYPTDDCSGAPSFTLTDGSCTDIGGLATGRLETELSGTCPPGTPAPTGDVAPAGLETFCCSP